MNDTIRRYDPADLTIRVCSSCGFDITGDDYVDHESNGVHTYRHLVCRQAQVGVGKRVAALRGMR